MFDEFSFDKLLHYGAKELSGLVFSTSPRLRVLREKNRHPLRDGCLYLLLHNENLSATKVNIFSLPAIPHAYFLKA